MFQAPNPLGSYTRHPYYESTADTADADADVPTLSQSQKRLAHNNKIQNILLKAAIVIAILLLIGVALFIYKKTNYYNCEGCINLNLLKDKAQMNHEDAIAYVERKVADATETNITEYRETLTNLDGVGKQVNSVLNLREKIDELLKLNSTFAKELKSVRESERDVQELGGKYNEKEGSLNRLTGQIIEFLTLSFPISTNTTEIRLRLDEYKNKIAAESARLNGEKQRIQANIKNLNDNILKALNQASARNDADLEQRIHSKADNLENRDQNKIRCENNINEYGEQISLYYAEKATEMQYLEDIEIELRQSKWVEHVLETIKKFEEIRNDLEVLKTDRLNDGLENIEKLIKTLLNREAEAIRLASGRVEISSKKTESETHRVSEDGHKKVDIYETLEETKEIYRSDDLAGVIAKERDLLINWASNQFKTFNISNNEIKNVTNTIHNFRKSILAEQLKDASRYEQLRASTIRIINEITHNITVFERQIQDCQGIINSSEDMIKQEEAELVRLKNIKGQIEALRNQIENEQKGREVIEEASKKSIIEFEEKHKQYQAQFDKGEHDHSQKEEELKRLTNDINSVIASKPNTQLFAKKLKEYHQQVEKVKTTSDSMRELLRQINSISQNQISSA